MGNPGDGAAAPAATAAPASRPKCQYADKCNRKNPDHFKEESHPGDADWDPPVGGYSAGAAPAAPYPDGQTEEERGFMGAAGGAAAAFGGMKVTGASDKMGFFGKAAVMAGAAVAGSMLQNHLGKGKKTKTGKNGKKLKKKKKKGWLSRDLDVGERGLPGEDEYVSGSGDSCYETDSDQDTPATASSQPRTSCKYGEKCYQKDPDHIARFSHPGDADWK